MTIRRIRNAWWVDFRWKGGRYRYKSPANSAQSAREYEQVLRGRLARGEPVMPAPEPALPRFADYARAWLLSYAATNNKPSEQRMKKAILRCHLVPAFGHRRIADIVRADIETYKATKRAAGYSPKTINNHLTVLRCCLQSAIDDDLLKELPRIVWLEYTAPPRDFLTVHEGNALLAAAAHPRWRAMILLGLRTGMRFGELAALQWEDIDLEQSIVTVQRSVVSGVVTRPKTHKIRFVPLAPSAREALCALPRRDGPIFHITPGRHVSHAAALRALHRICRAAGLRMIGWHTLRHSCASQIGKVRHNLLEAQRILGHSSLAMTEDYTHFVPDALHDAVASLDDAAAQDSAVGTGWSTRRESAAAHDSPMVRNFSQPSKKTFQVERLA